MNQNFLMGQGSETRDITVDGESFVAGSNTVPDSYVGKPWDPDVYEQDYRRCLTGAMCASKEI